MKRKGFSYKVTLEQIRAYKKLSPIQKLAWLAAANRFSHQFLKGQRKRAWEAFRRGSI